MSSDKHQPVTEAELAEWRKAEQEATYGPWEDWAGMMGWQIKTHDEELTGIQVNPHFAKNMIFVCTAREAMPRLLAEVERLRAVIGAAEKDIDEVAGRDCMSYSGCDNGWIAGQKAGPQCEHYDAGDIGARLRAALEAE